MICPLLYLGNITRFSQQHDPASCVENECAWWDDDAERCAILTLAAELRDTWALLRETAQARGELPPD